MARSPRQRIGFEKCRSPWVTKGTSVRPSGPLLAEVPLRGRLFLGSPPDRLPGGLTVLTAFPCAPSPIAARLFSAGGLSRGD